MRTKPSNFINSYKGPHPDFKPATSHTTQKEYYYLLPLFQIVVKILKHGRFTFLSNHFWDIYIRIVLSVNCNMKLHFSKHGEDASEHL
jgi:hypothetical protein